MSSPNWPRIRDLPQDERLPFNKWLDGQTRPVDMDVPQDEWDFYFPWDYERWKRGSKIVD